ncbi:MAG TPA: hypothetical protein VN523_08535 [Hyphomicrobiaceae bacterium]|nr:hypothetical protein [Hyphomicrobiaceae bacterium]
MHKALVIVPILGWVGVGALLHQTRGWPAVKADEGVVVVVPPRPTATSPAPTSPAAAPHGTLPRVSDRAGLARELHKELKRVGCYEGDISSAWTPTSRLAMRRFTESVNAKLPLEEPDLVLLRLVQSQAHRVCPCPAGTADGAKAACAESAAAAEPAKKSVAETRRDDGTPLSTTPLIVGAAATTAAAATVLARPEPNAGSAKPIMASPSAGEEDNRASRSSRQSGPTPPADVYSTRGRHTARRADSRPPAVVQSLVRNVQRALGSFGIR